MALAGSEMWSFSSNFDVARRRKLEAYDNFELVSELVCRFAQVVNADVYEGNDLGPKDCWRPMVELDVGKDAFDAFFNSPGGYRAQYLTDPDCGQAANNRLLRALEPTLTNAVVERCGEQHLVRGQIRRAFLANSAKVWPDEAKMIVAQASVDLEIALWNQPCDWINFPLNARLWAPQGTTLKAFGAFLDPWGNEVVSRKKILRRFDIYQCGFS